MGKSRKRKAQEALINNPPLKRQHIELKPTLSKSSLTPKSATRQFVEEPRGPELKREVELYEQLSSPDETERLEAADAVVSGLLGGEGVSEAVLRRHLERRLFRGLASGRKAARLGFSVVLTEVLAQILGKRDSLLKSRYAGLRFEPVVDMLKAKTKPEGDLSGQEERDHAFGLLFGLQCFVRAEILFTAEKEDREERWEVVFDNLLQLAKKKPWMREECGFVIVEALEQMKQHQAEETVKKLQDAGLAATPEGVGIWLKARRKFPGMRFPSKPWGQDGNPLEHLSALAKALKESSNATDKKAGEGVQQTGNWHHQLHFAWDIVLNEYAALAAVGLQSSSSAHFSDFWQVAVDESLFSSSASPERKFWGFLVFQRVLRDVPQSPQLLNDIFSQNFMRCLINHISQKDRFLYRAAEKCVKSLLQQAEATPEIVTIVIPKLVDNHGVYNFDQVTKTKTVEKLLNLLSGDDMHEIIIERIFTPIKTVKTTDSTRDAELRRQIFGDYLLSIIRRTNTLADRKANTWIEIHALPLLASLAYCKKEGFTPPLSEKTRTIFRNRLNSAFTFLIADKNAYSYPYSLLQTFNPSALDMDEEITMKKDEALVLIKKILKKAKKAAVGSEKPLQTFAMLFALVIFQLYNGESDAVSLLDELKLCYEKLIRGMDTEESDAEASVVLVEILLSFMAKQSALLRRVAQQAFIAFSGEITEESLKLLVDVLDSNESLKGQQELFEQEDDDLEHDNSDDSDEGELDSDVEILDVNGKHEHNSSSDEEQNNVHEESEDDVEDESEEEDEEEDDIEVRKLEEALAKALGTHRAKGDPEEDSSDSDANMSDSEMMALDSKLIEIFSQRKKQPNKKQEKKDARENIINFKSRVLDLLEIFVREQPGNPLAFDLLAPILKFMRSTTARQLNEKGYKVITGFAKASKAVKPDDSQKLDQSRRLNVLKDVHGEASKERSHAFSKAASTASLLVATALYRASSSNMKEIDAVYYDTQARWHGKEAVMQVSFFQDWLNWCQSHLA